MASSSVGVKSYTESKSLLQYEGKVELGEEQESSFGSGAKKKQLPPIESNPGIKETLYSMFLPREWEENGKKFIQYVSSEPATREKARDLLRLWMRRLRKGRQGKKKYVL